MRGTLIALAVAILTAGVPVGAHHSFAAHYFEDQSVSIEGEVLGFQCRSPHAILRFAARTPEGPMRTYETEWSNPRRLGGKGINRGTLKPGDVVVVTGGSRVSYLALVPTDWCRRDSLTSQAI